MLRRVACIQYPVATELCVPVEKGIDSAHIFRFWDGVASFVTRPFFRDGVASFVTDLFSGWGGEFCDGLTDLMMGEELGN